MVAENFESFICSPASLSFMGSVHTSISSVSMSARFFVCSRTKRATLSLCLPRREVPRIIGIKSGRSIWMDVSIVSNDFSPLLHFSQYERCLPAVADTPQSPIHKSVSRGGRQLKLPMAGLEPARAFYGPTDFKSDHFA